VTHLLFAQSFWSNEANPVQIVIMHSSHSGWFRLLSFGAEFLKQKKLHEKPPCLFACFMSIGVQNRPKLCVHSSLTYPQFSVRV
jgi:hypothetical protein